MILWNIGVGVVSYRYLTGDVLKTRTELIRGEHLSGNVKSYEKMFINGIVGIVLKKRGVDDSHIVFHLIVLDDRKYWRNHTRGNYSSYWLGSLSAVLRAATTWCKKQGITSCGGYGWDFSD